MLNISEIRKRFEKNPLKLQEELKKYDIKELYQMFEEIRKYHELSILKKVSKDRIIYKIRDYLLFIEKNIKNLQYKTRKKGRGKNKQATRNRTNAYTVRIYNKRFCEYTSRQCIKCSKNLLSDEKKYKKNKKI